MCYRYVDIGIYLAKQKYVVRSLSLVYVGTYKVRVFGLLYVQALMLFTF